MAGPTLRIALADDQALVRHGLRAVLCGFAGVEVVVDAEDADQLLRALEGTTVDVVVMDVRMPRLSGIEATRSLRARADRTPVLLLTTFDDPERMRQAAAAGAQGWLLKDAEPEALHCALERLAAGGSAFVPGGMPRRPGTGQDGTGAAGRSDGGGRVGDRDDRIGGGERGVHNLTERELAVLRLVAGGYANKEIGQILQISGGTVKNHMTDILSKLGARDRTHAVLKAIAAQLL